MTSIDLKDAYYSLPIAMEHQKYLKLFLKNSLYTFACLPMGLSSRPSIFTNVMKPIFSNLRSTFGHISLSCIDDSLYIGNTATECAEATLHVVQQLTRLGFNVNSEKSVIRPSQSVEFSGLIIDSVTMSVYITPRKQDRLSSLCLSFLSPGKRFTIRQVVSFIGKLVSAFPGVEFGPLHYRQLLAD